MHTNEHRGASRRAAPSNLAGDAANAVPSTFPSPMRAARPLAALLGVVLLGACAATREPLEPANDATSGTPTATVATTLDAPALAGALPGNSSSKRTGSAPTLYDELGGAAGVAALSESFIRAIAADDRVRGHYRDTDIGRFDRMMQLQMCERTGGGCTYPGDDMQRTHGGMNITPTEFNAIVEALMNAMDTVGLPVATQNRLLELYAPMRADIIDR